MQIQPKHIQETAVLLAPHVLRTPLRRSPTLSRMTGSEVYLKLESLQTTGSFKLRGAMSSLLRIAATDKSASVIAASAGNHGQGIALGASKLGLRATVVVPTNTPDVKVARIRGYGARLILHGADYDAAEAYARKVADEEDLTYVSPYNDERVVIGQGTVGLEIREQFPDVNTIIVPTGGGGLLAGIGIVAKGTKPAVDVIGVQSDTSPAMYEFFRTGKLVQTPVGESIAEGISGNIEKGSVTLGYVKRLVDSVVLVKEDSIRRAIRLLWSEGHVAEGAGAVPVAAILEHHPNLFHPGSKVALVITGGNIGETLFHEIVRDAR